MTERFSKLSLDDTDHIKTTLSDYDDIIHDYNTIHTSDNDNDDDDIKRNSLFASSSSTTNNNITTTTTANASPITSTNIKRNGSTSSNYDKINANLHARVKAFQEQRALKRSTSSGANRKASQERLETSSNTNNNYNKCISDEDIDGNELSLDMSSYTANTSLVSSVSKTLNKIVNKPLPPLPNLSHTDTHNISRSTSISSVSSKESTNFKNIENNDIFTTMTNNSIRSPIHSTIPSYNDFIQNISAKNLNCNNNNNNNINFDNTEIPEDLQSKSVLKHTTKNDDYDDKATNKTEKNSAIISPKYFNLDSYKESLVSNNNTKKNMNTATNVIDCVSTTKYRSDKEKVYELVNTTNDIDSSIADTIAIAKTTTTSTVQNTSNFVSQIPQQSNPNRRAPKRPVFTNMRAAIQTSQTIGTVQNRPQKQSLSARRGLKLPPGGMSLKMLTKSSPSTTTSSVHVDSQEFALSPINKNHHVLNHSSGRRLNPGSLINGVQTTSTSSSYDDNCDTEGTMPDNSSSNSSSLGSGGPGGLFSNFSKYVDIKSGSLNFAGKLSLSSKGIDFSNGSSSRITLDELEFLEELGHGNYGNVSKVLHKPTNVIMAMKEVRLELDEAKFRQILMELEVLHKCRSPYIVDFYGAFFIEGAVYMCIEYMDGGSLDKIYDQNPEIGGIDEPQLAYITDAVIRGLKELKEVHNIIHRDVKPTNILCSAQQGTIKLCDFGVSGNLVASMAKTNIGCQSYMAPERIKSLNPDTATYTVQSDIWSLGLSILEMALGRYPYPPETFNNIFSQLSAIVDGPPPKLPSGKFSAEAQEFVALCLQKIPERRPTYSKLLEHPWLVKYRKVEVGMSQYIKERLEIKKRILDANGENALPKAVPALHMGGLP